MDTKHLVNSKWTHLLPSERRRHFRVLSFSKAKQRVELMCVIDKSIHFYCLSELKDPNLWQAGWSQ